MRRLLFASVCLMAASPGVCYADASGNYIDEENPSIALVLVESPDGSLSGLFEGLSDAVPLTAQGDGAGYTGTLGGGLDGSTVRIAIEGDLLTLVLDFEGEHETHRFRRTGAPEPRGVVAAEQTPARPAPRDSEAASPAARNVVVNGERLTDADLDALERLYRVHIEDAHYWYDALSGAWGIEGGPTRGFIYSGLRLGGALKADSSGGGTNVFINGRELHPLDVDGLRRCTRVDPGRYWVGPDGIGGYEGGPPVFNLVSLCSSSVGGGRAGGWVCDGGSCGTTRTVTGPYAVTSEGDGRGGVYTDQGLILTPN